jgi:hypothetical protein
MQDREGALALGSRVTVAASRENDPNPVMWLAARTTGPLMLPAPPASR